MTVIGGNSMRYRLFIFLPNNRQKDGHALLMFKITNYEVNNKYSQITLTAPANLLEEDILW